MAPAQRMTSASPEIDESPLKRKRDDEATSRRKEKRKKQKRRNDIPADEDLDETLAINKSLARMDPQLIADHVARQTRRFTPDLTLIEQEELRIPATTITDMSEFTQDRRTPSLPKFLEAVRSKRERAQALSRAPVKLGTPHTLVVAAAGIRAADLTRTLRVFQTKDSTVAKLFAKHIKLAEAVEHVKTTRMGIGVGTPARISDLIDAGALSIEKLERIVVDFSHIDQKKRGVMDMKDTELPLVKLLNREELKSRYGAGSGTTDLAFF